MKYYIKPQTEITVVRLENSVMDDPGIGGWSYGTGDIDAKKQDFIYEDDGSYDLWSDNGNDEDEDD